MKDVATLLATVFVLVSLVGLLSADYNRDGASRGFLDAYEEQREVGWIPVLAKIAGDHRRIGLPRDSKRAHAVSRDR